MPSPIDRDRRQASYERVLALVDLTAGVQTRRALRRELLRWRDLVAEMYLRTDLDAAAHAAVFRALLQLTPAAAKQIKVLAAAR